MIEIFEGIQNHLSFLENARTSAESMLAASKTNNVDAVTNEADNFERLLKIVEETQKDIEQKIYLLDPKSVTNTELEILKLWVQEVNTITERINNIDELTLEQLNQLKDETGAEIAAVYSNREKIRGYAFSSVKK